MKHVILAFLVLVLTAAGGVVLWRVATGGCTPSPIAARLRRRMR
jgi:hypothetical protein